MYKLPIKICLFFLLFCLCGCATSYKIKSISDNFDGYTIHRLTGNRLSGSELFNSPVELNCQVYINRNGLKSYFLIVQYNDYSLNLSSWGLITASWLFIQRGESLILLVDGERIGFEGEGSIDHRNVYSGNIEEKAWYDISRHNLEKIANAYNVEVKIIGSEYYVQRQFSEKNISNFYKFISEF